MRGNILLASCVIYVLESMCGWGGSWEFLGFFERSLREGARSDDRAIFLVVIVDVTS